MSGYLLDTNVISVVGPGRDGDRPETEGVVAWLEAHTDELFLSAVSVMEIQTGIAKARRTGARRAEQLQAWLDRVVQRYADRVLPFDTAVARLAGLMADEARAQGRDPGLADTIIAATARAHEQTIVTRNVAHFRWLGVAIYNPFPT